MLIRAGLKEILAARPNIHVIEATTGQELIKKINSLDIHIAILDISMPGRNGLETLKEIKASHPKLPVLMLSVYPEDQYAIRSLKAGASGYLTKDSAPEMLLSAIDKLLKGEKFISPNLAHKLVSVLAKESIPHEKSRYGCLTISCGVGCSLKDKLVQATWNNVVEQADRALFQAKQDGKNRVVVDLPDAAANDLSLVQAR